MKQDFLEATRQEIERHLVRLMGAIAAPPRRFGGLPATERPESVTTVNLVKCGASITTTRLDTGKMYASPKRFGYAFAVPHHWLESVLAQGLDLVEEQMICLEAKPRAPPDVCDGCYKVVLAKLVHNWGFQVVNCYCVKIAGLVRIGNTTLAAHRRCCQAHLEALGITP